MDDDVGHTDKEDSPWFPPDVAQLVQSDQIRLFGLYCLYVFGNPLYLPRIADHVTEWVYGESPRDLQQERLEIYMSLYHDHIPVLVKENILRYDQAKDHVMLTDWAKQSTQHIETMIEDEPL